MKHAQIINSQIGLRAPKGHEAMPQRRQLPGNEMVEIMRIKQG